MRYNLMRKLLLRLGGLGSAGLLLQTGGCSMDTNTFAFDWASTVVTSLITGYFNDLAGVSTGLSFF